MTNNDFSLNLPNLKSYLADVSNPPKPTDFKFTNPLFASESHDVLLKVIKDFEDDLDNEHEVGIRLVTFGNNTVFHVDYIGYYNPTLVVFYGTLDDGTSVQLVQHVSQLNILLVAAKRLDPSKPKKRIGFSQEESEDESAATEED